jgi:hypothetical protein
MRAITWKNASYVLILLLVASATAWAQTTTSTIQTISFQLKMPGCVNNGKGENVNFSSTNTRVLYTYKLNADGTKTGTYMYVPGYSFTGRGATTGMSYTAYGSNDQEFANQDSFGDGQFSITQNYRVFPAGLTSVAFHYQQNFTVTNQGNTLQLPPAVTVCK